MEIIIILIISAIVLFMLWVVCIGFYHTVKDIYAYFINKKALRMMAQIDKEAPVEAVGIKPEPIEVEAPVDTAGIAPEPVAAEAPVDTLNDKWKRFYNDTTVNRLKGSFMKSITFKGITIVILTFLLLIPGVLIQNLITERQDRSEETIKRINDKWGDAQVLCGPLLLVPYTTVEKDKDNKTYYKEHKLFITPEDLKITASLTPEERHYGIFKAILYKSDIRVEGKFPELVANKNGSAFHKAGNAKIVVGVTDLKGVAQNPEFKINDTTIKTDAESFNGVELGKVLFSELKNVVFTDTNFLRMDSLRFDCVLRLNGSGSISFVPVGQNTEVSVSGQWSSPSFIGGFSPESTIDKGRFGAVWNILSFNRAIPEVWVDDKSVGMYNYSFGVNLIETVDGYQQNMRCAKYALMFIALTFIVFFFVEIFTKKTIQVFQYVLVGIALVLFYSLLLSFSEQIGFGLAYLTASLATVSLITAYFYSLIKQKFPTLILAAILFMLYGFLYVILQIEDFALLLGSVFLFVVLGVVMFVSNKIKLQKQQPDGGGSLDSPKSAPVDVAVDDAASGNCP